MLKETITIQMSENGFFKDAFPNGIPANSNTDKSKTGNGMTRDALLARGHYIIINPQVNTIDSKEEWCKIEGINVLKIHGDDDPKLQTSDAAIEAFLREPLLNKKILVTPESFPRIIKCAAKLNKLKELYKDYFCLLDESHCYASEKFRKLILNPLYYVFKFDRIALGSATPFNYSHPRIAALQKYKLVYPSPFGHIKIINCNNALSTLHHFITNGDFPGNVHIFLNSVTAIGNMIASTKITDVKIHCVDNKDNRIKLGENARFLSMQTDGVYNKWNSYTCRYDEGWDMIDDPTATIIFVTDKSIPHSMQSISIKGVQSVGRLRNVKPHAIYHITNNYGIASDEMQTSQEYTDKVKKTANSHIAYYNAFHSTMDFDPSLYQLVKPYVYKNMRAYKVVDPGKIDQHIYEIQARAEYSNKRSIADAWESRNYTTTSYFADLPEIEIKDRSHIEIKRQILNLLIKYLNNPESYRYGEASEVFGKLKAQHNILLQCYQLFGIAEIENLEYDNSKMKQRLIQHNNDLARNKICKILDARYKVNDKPARTDLKELLQELYSDYGYFDNNGKIKTATATDIKLFGFRVDNDKTECINGIRQSALKITSKDFTFIQAA